MPFISDKMCDQISDAVLDAHLKLDPDSKVIDVNSCILKYTAPDSEQPTQQNVFLTKYYTIFWGQTVYNSPRSHLNRFL